MGMDAQLKSFWKRRRWAVIAVAAAVVASAAFGAVRLSRSAPSIPTAVVRKGEFVDYMQARGEVAVLKSVILIAPSNAGDIQIIKLVRNGTRVKKGDVLVEFDVSNLKRTLDQKRSELKQAQAELEQIRAQARLQQEQDRTDSVKAGYDVERAKLEASKQEIVSKIDGEKAKLLLADAEQKRRETEQRVNSDKAGAAADEESKKQKIEKASFDVRRAEQGIAALTLKAPSDGLVTLLPNWRASSGFGSAPEFKEGDRAWPGASIAELPDLSTIRVSARMDETDRGRLKVSQTATVRVDAVPDKELPGRIVEISLLAKPDFSIWPVVKNFDLIVGLEKPDPRLRPGMSATARIAVDRLRDSILIPAEASFQKGGRTVAYVLRGSAFEERAVETGRRGDGQVVVAKGLGPGERVALKDPTAVGH